MASATRVEELVKRLERDQSLASKIGAAQSNGDRRSLLDQNGFGDVRMDEVEAYLSAAGASLSDETLEQIAGGQAIPQ